MQIVYTLVDLLTFFVSLFVAGMSLIIVGAEAGVVALPGAVAGIRRREMVMVEKLSLACVLSCFAAMINAAQSGTFFVIRRVASRDITAEAEGVRAVIGTLARLLVLQSRAAILVRRRERVVALATLSIGACAIAVGTGVTATWDGQSAGDAVAAALGCLTLVATVLILPKVARETRDWTLKCTAGFVFPVVADCFSALTTVLITTVHMPTHRTAGEGEEEEGGDGASLLRELAVSLSVMWWCVFVFNCIEETCKRAAARTLHATRALDSGSPGVCPALVSVRKRRAQAVERRERAANEVEGALARFLGRDCASVARAYVFGDGSWPGVQLKRAWLAGPTHSKGDIVLGGLGGAFPVKITSNESSATGHRYGRIATRGIRARRSWRGKEGREFLYVGFGTDDPCGVHTAHRYVGDHERGRLVVTECRGGARATTTTLWLPHPLVESGAGDCGDDCVFGDDTRAPCLALSCDPERGTIRALEWIAPRLIFFREGLHADGSHRCAWVGSSADGAWGPLDTHLDALEFSPKTHVLAVTGVCAEAQLLGVAASLRPAWNGGKGLCGRELHRTCGCRLTVASVASLPRIS